MNEEDIIPVVRTIYTERLYNLAELGQYNNIKFSNALSGIPENIAMNPRAVELLYVQQYLALEIAYRQYKALVLATSKMDAEEALKYLKEKRTQTFKSLLEEVGATNVKPSLEEPRELEQKETE